MLLVDVWSAEVAISATSAMSAGCLIWADCQAGVPIASLSSLAAELDGEYAGVQKLSMQGRDSVAADAVFPRANECRVLACIWFCWNILWPSGLCKGS